jgi:2'-5' RNA ligase
VEQSQDSVACQAAELREAHRATVTGNRVRLDGWWAQSCRAYNLHILPAPPAREALSRVQARLTRLEPGLHVVPTAALHISVAWLLAVHADYERPKDELWATHGDAWTRQLARIASEIPPFRLRYGQVVATDSAIIALASPRAPVNALREEVAHRVALPPQTRNTAELVHTTLCRYQRPLTDPARLLAAIESTRVGAGTEVSELVISQERVYPSLETRLLARLPLQGRVAS